MSRIIWSTVKNWSSLVTRRESVVWAQAVEIIQAQENYALSNQLSAYFVSVRNLRLARKTLEQGLALGELRFEQRLRLLETLGSVTFESGDEKKSKEIFEQVERMEPNSAIARYHLLALAAGTAIRSNRLNDAIACYRQMLQTYPQQREVNLQLGKLLLQTGDTVAARAMFDVCIQDNYGSTSSTNCLNKRIRAAGIRFP